MSRATVAPDLQMTVEEFLSFTASRPDEERWELIEGVPVMNPSPTTRHQLIVANLSSVLAQIKLETAARWTPLLGVGTVVPGANTSLPTPDLMVIESSIGVASPTTSDALVVFEVLSKSNMKAEQAWRRRVYASIPNCRHYVTVAQTEVAVTLYDGDAGWSASEITAIDAALVLPALGPGITIPLADIYRWTPLVAA